MELQDQSNVVVLWDGLDALGGVLNGGNVCIAGVQWLVSVYHE